MFLRLPTVALLTAGTALAFSTAQAQTSGSGRSTMTPSTGSTMGSGSGSTGAVAFDPYSVGAIVDALDEVNITGEYRIVGSRKGGR